MKTEIYAELKGSRKVQPVFEGLKVEAELRESLAITTITQKYRSTSSLNMEIVYTFPHPLDAVLLEMIVTIGDKTLKGTVLPKQEAEEKYEDAITDGDAPVMLQNPEPGVFTMNMGNLKPGESASIKIRYAMFMRWQGDTLRYHLPTTIAPRYGSMEKAGFEVHQVPETSLLVDNLFDFEMKITGKLAQEQIESPSHEIAIKRVSEKLESNIRLARKTTYMDRDLIISVKRSLQLGASATVERDGDEYLLWGSFQPSFCQTEDSTPRSIKIVVDCSGSMAGDSIAQAREALLRVLDELKPQDWFNIIVFGNDATSLFNAQTKADRESISYARSFLKKMGADMGGTEIGKALEMAVRLRCPEKIQQDILLITDGEITEWQRVVGKAIKSKHRFFTVGVGSSVAEAFVRTLAERTGGACELVSPNENMADKIHRHFKRIGTPRSSNTEIIWPATPLRVYPEYLPAIYDGDTCNLFAWFTNPPSGEVQLRMALPDGSSQILAAGIESHTVVQTEDNTISRMVAALRLREIEDEKTGQDLAVKYQLVSKWSNYIAILVRDEADKADTLPELHKVQQMLAAGWGGTGRTGGEIKYCWSSHLDYSESTFAYKKPFFSRSQPSSKSESRSLTSYASQGYSRMRTFVANCFAPAPAPSQLPFRREQGNLGCCVEMLDQVISNNGMPSTIKLPLLPENIELVLQQLVDEGYEELIVVTLFLHYLACSKAGSGFSRQSKRVITKVHKKLSLDSHSVEVINKQFKIAIDEITD